MAESRVEVTHKSDQTLMDVFALIGTLWMTYYILDPDALERHKALALSAWQGLKHQISIWQAKRDIQSLPEIDNPE